MKEGKKMNKKENIKNDRIEFYKNELNFWKEKKEMLLNGTLKNDFDIDYIDSKIENYDEWLSKELQEY